MRVLVISDTHKKHENLKVILERVSPVDLVIHLGDAEGYEDYIGELCGCPLEIVAGNNDFFSSLPREKEIMAGNYRVFMTHGHYYYVGSGIEDLKREALARGADVAMFGHTAFGAGEYCGSVVQRISGKGGNQRRKRIQDCRHTGCVRNNSFRSEKK